MKIETVGEARDFMESLRKRRRRIAKMVVAIVLFVIWYGLADWVVWYALSSGYNLNPWHPLDYLTLPSKIILILLVHDVFMFSCLVFGVIVISGRWGEKYKEPEKSS